MNKDERLCAVCGKLYHPIADMLARKYVCNSLNGTETWQKWPVDICVECWIRGEKKHTISWEGRE